MILTVIFVLCVYNWDSKISNTVMLSLVKEKVSKLVLLPMECRRLKSFTIPNQPKQAGNWNRGVQIWNFALRCFMVLASAPSPFHTMAHFAFHLQSHAGRSLFSCRGAAVLCRSSSVSCLVVWDTASEQCLFLRAAPALACPTAGSARWGSGAGSGMLGVQCSRRKGYSCE